MASTEKTVDAFTVRLPVDLMRRLDKVQAKLASKLGVRLSRSDFMNMVCSWALSNHRFEEAFEVKDPE